MIHVVKGTSHRNTFPDCTDVIITGDGHNLLLESDSFHPLDILLNNLLVR